MKKRPSTIPLPWSNICLLLRAFAFFLVVLGPHVGSAFPVVVVSSTTTSSSTAPWNHHQRRPVHLTTTNARRRKNRYHLVRRGLWMTTTVQEKGGDGDEDTTTTTTRNHVASSAATAQTGRSQDRSLLYYDDEKQPAQEEEIPSSPTTATTRRRHRRSARRRYSVSHILHPLAFPDPIIREDDETAVNLVTAFAHVHTALLRLRDSDHQMLSQLVRDESNDDDKNSTMMIRLEMAVDPYSIRLVRWLIAVQQQQQQQQKNMLPMLYMQTPHRTVAAVGIARRRQSRPSSGGGRVGTNGTTTTTTTTTDDNIEEESSLLPEKSVWYGAGRFDIDYPYKDDRWRSLEDYWILPVVELIQKRRHPPPLPPPATTKTTTQHIRPDTTTLTLAIHVSRSTIDATTHLVQELLRQMSMSSAQSDHWRQPLPPILSRSTAYAHAEENYEEAVEKALAALEEEGDDDDASALLSSTTTTTASSLATATSKSTPVLSSSSSPSSRLLQKVVLARSQTLHFGQTFSALHVLDQLLLQNDGEVAHGMVFYLRGQQVDDDNNNNAGTTTKNTEFWGATPEKLFEIRRGILSTEALAGTRTRGRTAADDDDLLQELIDCPKEMRENRLTADFCEDILTKAARQGLVEDTVTQTFGVRRLRHLQHICRQYSTRIIIQQKEQAVNNDDDDELPLEKDATTTTTPPRDLTQYFLDALHPTPAVGGLPQKNAVEFLRSYEGWDRGLYAGPVGYLGRADDGDDDDTYVAVAIRSALSYVNTATKATEVQVFGGSGLVKGSTLHGEWSETNAKLNVLASLFPPSPVTLRSSMSSTTPNVAWSTAFCEELVRNGVTQFYICPGSRSTPLVVALVQAAKKNPSLQIVSVHDERAAGFRAVGYARGAGQPAVIVTSSGTAVANLYPAVVEASQDGLPMIVLTADRPYESRNTGANQAIDQVKMFASSYIRWWCDILPPSDDVPVSAALSDACHAVHVATEQRGPVHVNVQFRENLAPEAGPIRNDPRPGSITRFNGVRFTDVPGFARWSSGGQPWQRSYHPVHVLDRSSVRELAALIRQSRRGIIVLGGLRQEGGTEEESALRLAIASFAEQIGFPIVAGAQCASLRFTSSAVIPFAEHLFRAPTIRDKLNLDLVIQIGWPLVSTAIPAVMQKYAKRNNGMAHILIHPHTPAERLDPDATVTHRVSVRPGLVLAGLLNELGNDDVLKLCHSELYPLVPFGRQLQTKMQQFVSKASEQARVEERSSLLTEPEIMMDLAESFTQDTRRNLFLSSSMPVRDAEMFLYPYDDGAQPRSSVGLGKIGCNRGASGIDGVIASALGFAEGTNAPTTLVVGDVATLHDVGSLFSLREHSEHEKRRNPLTTVVVNNNGGGIFSFLPIARHKSESEFDTYFGTPTSKASFARIAKAFGVEASTVEDRVSFVRLYRNATLSNVDAVVETQVFEREANVRVHTRTNEAVQSYIEERLGDPLAMPTALRLYQKNGDALQPTPNTKTMLLLHGWMGSSKDWDDVVSSLSDGRLGDWKIVTVDLTGHGKSPRVCVSTDAFLKIALDLDIESELADLFSVDKIASAVEEELVSAGIEHLDALIGYSAGGRVALSMKGRSDDGVSSLVSGQTKMILIGANPGRQSEKKSDAVEALSAAICKGSLSPNGPTSAIDSFVRQWYEMPMWGGLQEKDGYVDMARKRVEALQERGNDLLQFFKHASNSTTGNGTTLMDRTPDNTLFVAGTRDQKYVKVGQDLQRQSVAAFEQVNGAGHALLTEAAEEVAKIVETFLCRGSNMPPAAPVDLANNMVADSDPLEEATAEAVETTNISIISPTAEPANNQGVSEERPATKKVDERQTTESLPKSFLRVEAIEYMPISFSLQNEEHQPLRGIGWGDKAKVAEGSSPNSVRQGFIIQLKNQQGREVGVGEVSPLRGVHKSTVEEVAKQLSAIQQALMQTPLELNSDSILALDGYLQSNLHEYAKKARLPELSRSLYAGVEMAILSMASQIEGVPLHLALTQASGTVQKGKIQVNGLVARSSSNGRQKAAQGRIFSSYKVKVGHESFEKDQAAMKEVYRLMAHNKRAVDSKVRPDANRAWNESEAIRFVTALEGIDLHALERIEFIEEPLKLSPTNDTRLEDHVVALKRSFLHTGIRYALDESIADLAEDLDWNFERMREVLLGIFGKSNRGCAAFVLKPTVLGLELSLRLARLAREGLGLGAVFSSCFESGLGLAHIAMLSYAADGVGPPANVYAHGLGTFASLSSDTLNPSFGSYVDNEGRLNVASLSRSLFGLGLYELNQIKMPTDPIAPTARLVLPSTTTSPNPTYEASSALGPNEEINVVASVILPFTADTAFAKFTDLPAMSRWSPWIQNVRYDGNETEWTLNVRGVPIRWRATSEIINNEPGRLGIQWRSVAGIENSGTVEFVVPADDDDNNNYSSCRMNVDMKIHPPRLLQPLFRNASVLLEDFLRDKLLKWSLEMFRDAVKADMALERGDIELGDALIGAVEGKATAIAESL